MDVIFVQVPRFKRRANKRVQPQLGIAYIASYLLENGIEVGVIDGEVQEYTVGEIADQIVAANPMAVGITTTSEDRFSAINLAREIKKLAPNILLFAGGPHFSYSARDAMENVPHIDAVAIGEGEFTTYEMLKAFESGTTVHQFHNIHGCAFRNEEGEVVLTPPRGLIKKPDDMPGPAWHLFDMKKYQLWLSVEEQTRAIGVISSRGCPSKCVFCSNSLNRVVRYRTPKLFVDEIEYLHREYGFPGLNFQDDSFTFNRKHVRHICKEIIRRNLNIRWYCSLRVNNVSRELLGLMKEAGCVALGYGIETGSDRLLKAIRKGITTEQIREAMGITKELGFKHISLFLMTSLPGETKEDIETSSKFLSEISTMLQGAPVRKVFFGTPTLVYPGTTLERLAMENGNVFPPDFSWNRYYETKKAEVFGSNPFIPHFENPGFSLEDIKATGERLTWAWEKEKAIHRFFELLRGMRSVKDLIGLVKRTLRALPVFLNLGRSRRSSRDAGKS